MWWMCFKNRASFVSVSGKLGDNPYMKCCVVFWTTKCQNKELCHLKLLNPSAKFVHRFRFDGKNSADAALVFPSKWWTPRQNTDGLHDKLMGSLRHHWCVMDLALCHSFCPEERNKKAKHFLCPTHLYRTQPQPSQIPDPSCESRYVAPEWSGLWTCLNKLFWFLKYTLECCDPWTSIWRHPDLEFTCWHPAFLHYFASAAVLLPFTHTQTHTSIYRSP